MYIMSFVQFVVKDISGFKCLLLICHQHCSGPISIEFYPFLAIFMLSNKWRIRSATKRIP